MQVIDIPSSPEPPGSSMARRTRSASRQPGPSKTRPRLAAREPSIVEIIELTDSDDDLPAPKRPHRQPGPSRPTPATASNPALTFGKPQSGILADAPPPAPGPSQHVARRERQGDGVPLFLPASDDEQRVIHPPPAPVAQDIPDAALAHPPPPPEPAAPQAPAPVDPIDEYVVRVLEIVPDVQPTHALALIEQFMQSQPGNVVEFVLHALFEDPSYPKADKKGKNKQVEPVGDSNVRGSPSPKLDYTSKERVYDCGPHYFDCSLVSNFVELRHSCFLTEAGGLLGTTHGGLSADPKTIHTLTVIRPSVLRTHLSAARRGAQERASSIQIKVNQLRCR